MDGGRSIVISLSQIQLYLRFANFNYWKDSQMISSKPSQYSQSPKEKQKHNDSNNNETHTEPPQLIQYIKTYNVTQFNKLSKQNFKSKTLNLTHFYSIAFSGLLVPSDSHFTLQPLLMSTILLLYGNYRLRENNWWSETSRAFH